MLLAALVLPLVAHAGDYKPRLFKSMELVYEDQFDKDGPFNPKQWVVRQETRWEVKDGILVGSSSTKEYQQKMIAKGDSHTGIIPVIFLKPVPAEFVVQMRVRYDGQYTGTKIPLLDLGHHHNSLYFGKDASGDPIIEDLARMPHMLIAGTTGSGKSVCINSIIMAIQFLMEHP